MSSRIRVKSWLTEEIQFGTTKDIPSKSSRETASMLARILSSNYRLSGALQRAEGGEVDFLQEVRMNLARGHLDSASQLIQSALLMGVDSDPTLLSDIQLELMRLHYQNGNYLETVKLGQRILDGESVAGITYLTVLQIRSTAYFELGEWTRTLADVERVQSMAALYPEAQSTFYAKVTEVKVRARVSGAAEGHRGFAALLKHCLSRGSLNGDELLTLLRLAIDLARLQNHDIAGLSYASYLVADAMGDQLYSALALVDLQYSECEVFQSIAKEKLKAVGAPFKKVEQLLHECETLTPASASAHTILDYAPKVRSGNTPSAVPPKHLILLNSSCSFDLTTLQCLDLKLQQRGREILEALRYGPLKKEFLFQRIWKLKYVPERHDVILRNAIARVRKQAGVSITSADGRIALDDCWVISEI